MRVSSIDLGFSEEEPTVGVVFQPDADPPGETFGDGICRVNSWLARMAAENENQCILVIEAPLSMALTSHGNPCHRQIELQRNYALGASPRGPKGWYYQAGANLSLGSTIFLSNLVVPDGLKILLVEGFYCRVSPDESPASHQQVAERLLQRLLHLKEPLVTPLPDEPQGTVRVLPGMENLVEGIPGILLRDGLQLKP